MPVVFFGHGSPMNVLEDNRYTRAWREIGRALPRPRAVLCVSAHWYTRGTGVTAAQAPKTIHDFYGFPRELYALRYPAPGDPVLAARVRDLLAPTEVALDHEWGLDHGAWAVLRSAYPDADVPAVQLSIDGTQPASFHYALGRRLAPLRDEGVLLAGSGNVVHNLSLMARSTDAARYDWAVRFNDFVRDALARGDHRALVRWEDAGEDARRAIPTPEHYLPLVYCLGALEPGEPVRIAVDGIDLGSISMLSAVFGAAPSG
ncbi:MAG: 4,5-DOPA dioxygenase extradiol [Burkholderiales bacterium]|nr:4,5-DOPA dioxygenase extradiol [Burkholderiales bacterium]